MTKHILFSSAIVLLFSCGSPQEAKTEAKPADELLPSTEVDGPIVAKDTLPAEVIPEAEKAVENKQSEAPKNDVKKEESKEGKPAAKPGKATLHGSWELEKIYGAKEPFNMLFPNKKPTITFDLKENFVNGNNGCNSYNGNFELKNGVLKIGDMIQTKMFCEGVKESLYMATLKMANNYKIEGGKLILKLDDEPIMGFTSQK